MKAPKINLSRKDTNHLLKVVTFAAGKRYSNKETIGQVCIAFHCNTMQLTGRAGRDLGDVSHMTIWRLL
jgi:hypothetical protein